LGPKERLFKWCFCTVCGGERVKNGKKNIAANGSEIELWKSEGKKYLDLSSKLVAFLVVVNSSSSCNNIYREVVFLVV